MKYLSKTFHTLYFVGLKLNYSDEQKLLLKKELGFDLGTDDALKMVKKEELYLEYRKLFDCFVKKETKEDNDEAAALSGDLKNWILNQL